MSTSPFKAYNANFAAITGPAPTLDCLLQVDEFPFAHEAGVFLAATDELLITSNQYPDPVTNVKKVQISRVVLSLDRRTAERHDVDCDAIQMGNGGVNYNNDKEVLFCAQGSMTQPSGLFAMETKPPYNAREVITTFLGRPFNSVNDVVVQRDSGRIWFTDPSYGHEQGYRPRPRLPSQVYCYVPDTDTIRAVADGFGHPNGLCFSPDEKILYLTDTDWIHGDGTTDDSHVSSIVQLLMNRYAFDVVYYSGEPFLTNRRLFAMADTGIPDGIKCDMAGNVYSGCGDGINVWSPGGVLLGKVLVEGGAANFCFGRDGELFILNETRLWRLQLGPGIKGAILGI
ncbi:hypothetical protein SBRCBS47491_001623 [Sporothrix bragantina]|uniref:SMP-30/Gluconolactonase/LRE-like region domain-containing protein n=1 Tax=Sporothrix bragantina TaxID=671064 RepID=A0ABP0B028_9PEZI